MVDLGVFTYPIKKGRTSTISGIIDFGDSGLGDPRMILLEYFLAI